jgi:hypothetical protein
LPKFPHVAEVDRDALRQLGNRELHQFIYDLGLVEKEASPKQTLRALEASALDTRHARGQKGTS